MAPLEGLQNGADSKTKEHPELGASMECVQAMLQTIQTKECSTAIHAGEAKSEAEPLNAQGSTTTVRVLPWEET